MQLELCGVERIMATSLPLSLLVTPPSNQASHGSAGYFCKYVYHVFRGGELERRTNGVWQRRKIGGKGRQMAIRAVVISGIFAVDPWAPNVDSQSIASLLFAASLFPYLGFLYHLTKSQSAPKLTLFGFYFLLAFVGATIPAGIYAKIHYGTSLSNVDWLHGSAESLLTLTNLFIVLGLRQSLRKEESRQRSLDINNKKGTTTMEKERTSV